MNAEQPHRYSGVTRHEGKWMAKFRHAGRRPEPRPLRYARTSRRGGGLCPLSLLGD